MPELPAIITSTELGDLTDYIKQNNRFNQEHPSIDSYLKSAFLQLQAHHGDGFRLDAVKHVTWGWEYSMANTVFPMRQASSSASGR